MLASTHFYFRLTLLTFFALVFSAGSPGQSVLPGQFQGVPTTPFHGVPAVPVQGVPNAGGLNPALGRQGANYFNQGAFGYASPFLGNCCNDFVSPSGHSQHGSHSPFRSERRHHHLDGSTYVVPAYIPYAVPYAVEGDDANDDYDGADDGAQAPPDLDYSQSRHISKDAAHRRSVQGSGVAGNGGPAVGPEDEDAIDAPRGSFPAKDAPENLAEPITVQPDTVLIFKDGHRSEVVNYAIVGDTLFQFVDGRARKILLSDLDLPATLKINEDQGVDFTVPQASGTKIVSR
jgi:hypothetical protein